MLVGYLNKNVIKNGGFSSYTTITHSHKLTKHETGVVLLRVDLFYFYILQLELILKNLIRC